MFMSIGPWPMSALPVHEPTRVFIRSNSGEPALGLSFSAALAQSAAASNRAVQMEVIFVFMIFRGFVLLLMRLHEYNERGMALRTQPRKNFLKVTNRVRGAPPQRLNHHRR